MAYELTNSENCFPDSGSKTDVKEAGCEKIFSDRGVSGAKTEHPGLDQAFDHVRKKDMLIVWKLDRLGHALSHLLSTLKDFKQRGAHFTSVQDSFDTSTISGEMVFSVIDEMAEYKRNLMRERTMAFSSAPKAELAETVRVESQSLREL